MTGLDKLNEFKEGSDFEMITADEFLKAFKEKGLYIPYMPLVVTKFKPDLKYYLGRVVTLLKLKIYKYTGIWLFKNIKPEDW